MECQTSATARCLLSANNDRFRRSGPAWTKGDLFAVSLVKNESNVTESRQLALLQIRWIKHSAPARQCLTARELCIKHGACLRSHCLDRRRIARQAQNLLG